MESPSKPVAELVKGDIVYIENPNMRARVTDVYEGDMWELLPGYHELEDKGIRQPCYVVWVAYERPVTCPDTGWPNSYGCFRVDPDAVVRIYERKRRKK